MAHFALIGDDNTVETVIVIANEDCGGEDFPASEPIGQAFIDSMPPHAGKNWKQTSYSHSFRKQYAPIGGKYDPVADVFIQRQPYPSWSLDANFDWQPPVPKPEGPYVWNEETQSWETK